MAEILWQPSEEKIRQTNMYRFIQFVNERYGLDIPADGGGYGALHEWSVNHLADFWSAVWDFTGIIASSPYDRVVDDPSKMPGAEWFEGARLNFAENLLRYRDDQTAIISRGENRKSVYISYKDLYAEVAKVASALKDQGIGPGHRVAGFMPNIPEAVIAMLAATSLGATWSSCSPDFGIKSILDRFGQIEPTVLFAADGYFFKGKQIDCLERIMQIGDRISSIKKIAVIGYATPAPDLSKISKGVLYSDFKNNSATEVEFEQLPANHPLYIMYSSGTTGLPKCMVQGSAGILVNHLKELVLHTNLGRKDVIFYFTTCGWMMWNWLVSSLAAGACILLYEGNPFFPDGKVLWKMAEEEKITVFGTSAGYLTALRNTGFRPGDEVDLSHLKAILSTGSPLLEEGFRFVYEAVKSDVQLSSISGGTDLNGCFALGNPMGAVYAGELQCRGLGMKVEAFDETGTSVMNRQGELVCTAPFPSMPLYFWNDPDGSKYKAAYFDVYPGKWRHGDFIEIYDHGGLKIYGRSDATLNPGGVRIGTAEIYRIVEEFSQIQDSLVIGRKVKGDELLILFVKMTEGRNLDDGLVQDLRNRLKTEASPRHVPSKVIQVPDIPYTLNMKKVEIAVKNLMESKPVTNREALINPECLDFYANIDVLENS
jgi:acetoacetyl-CoA synthetase